MAEDLIGGIDAAYRERTDLVVFALTGRTGSGCSTAASILSKGFDDLMLSPDSLVTQERRKFDIANEFAKKQWIPFKSITVSSVIFSIALREDWPLIEKLLAELKVPDTSIGRFKGSLEALKSDPRFETFVCGMESECGAGDRATAWEFFSEAIEAQARTIKKELGASYSPVFQRFGDNLRCSGSLTESTARPEHLFALMHRVRMLINAAEASQRRFANAARVVVDAIRNPHELVYLRDHFASLYVIAVTVDDETRRLRLTDSGLAKRDIDRLDNKEYGERKHLSDYPSFVSQNIRDCIQKADIFVANPGKPGDYSTSVGAMNVQLVRYVALALRPGLVTPTRDERCMQVAFVAKLNSGCISRQVGAAVADSGYSIQAVGWNDVPKGQIPCLLRDVDALLSGGDPLAFSDFEKRDSKLRTHLQEKFAPRQMLRTSHGVRCPYCFKDAYNTTTKEKNQVHTRSLHAEENAFLQLAKRGSTGIEGGVLYTTASPCELCSKKAYQLGIKEVVYVDPYPGISASHILGSGHAESRPSLRLFSGAVGHAYHRLYEALLSIKDEYAARLSRPVQDDLPLTRSK